MYSRKSIAIVGCGPKGLYALDSLSQSARKTPALSFEVHIFEPAPCCGAGPVYDPAQPDTLLMNFPAAMIDAWTQKRGPNFLEWAAGSGFDLSPSDYVPRAVVGRYLNWCFRRVTDALPANIRFHRHSTRVTAVRRDGSQWRVAPRDINVDEVLVTTGHQDWTRANDLRAAGQIHSPFPIDQALDCDAVPTGARRSSSC